MGLRPRPCARRRRRNRSSGQDAGEPMSRRCEQKRYSRVGDWREAIDGLPDYMIGAIEEAQERDEHAHRQESDKEAAELVDPQAIEDAEQDALDDADDDEKQ